MDNCGRIKTLFHMANPITMLMQHQRNGRAKGMEEREGKWNEMWSTCSKHCTHCNNNANSSRRYWRKLRVKESQKSLSACEEAASKEEDTRASFTLLLRKVWVNNVAKLSACYGCSSFFCYMVPVFQRYGMVWCGVECRSYMCMCAWASVFCRPIGITYIKVK